MKIILLQDVKGVGKRNQTIEVKDGYANFLLNSGKALACSNKSQEIASKKIAEEKSDYSGITSEQFIISAAYAFILDMGIMWAFNEFIFQVIN